MIKEFRKYIATILLMGVIHILPDCTFKVAYNNFIKKYIHLL